MALGPVAQIHISVTDLERSVAFYRDVLGIPHLFTVPGQPMAFFQSGGVRLYLGVPETEDFRSHTVHYYSVDDIDAEYARLQAEDAPIVTPLQTEPWGERFLQAADPNGGIIQLVQWVDTPA
jgi:predicted enzyme related to lactoylglutathione lyase